MTDAHIRRSVEAELRWEPGVNNSRAIHVAVSRGVTTLSGFVHSYAERWAAERAAERVRGVTGVVSDLVVLLPDGLERTDNEIAQRIESALDWNLAVPRDRITIEVNDGRVRLEGDVDWPYQRDAIESAVRYLAGVKSISMVVAIKSPSNAAAVRSEIESALSRSARLDAHTIGVKVNGHNVTLTGRVRSCAERKEAERAAWSTPGVYVVDSHISVRA